MLANQSHIANALLTRWSPFRCNVSISYLGVFMTKFMLFAATATLALLPVSAQAAPIIYTISGTGAGVLNGSAFNASNFSFTLTGDTANVTTSGNFQVNDPLTSAAFNIAGAGAGTFSFATRFGQFGAIAFFSRSNSIGGSDLFDFTGANVNIANSFGPFAGTGVFALSQFQNVQTSAGLLSFNAASNIVYSGALGTPAVPEPATWAMLVMGFGLVGAALRRRQATVRVTYA
jgi:PEP-CTERM motif